MLDIPNRSLRPVEVRLHLGKSLSEAVDETRPDVLTTDHTETALKSEWFQVSATGVYVQLIINQSPMELFQTRPDDGVEFVKPGIPDGPRLVLKAREFGVPPA